MLAHPDSSFIESNVDLQEPALYDACRLSFGLATMLPRRAYTSDTFQRLENEKVWTREWVCVGAADQIGNVDDLLPYTIGQHAIHVQRQRDGGLIGRFNKAQHGGCRSVPAQCRTGRKTKCSYTSCGHSRDRDVIPGDALGEMSPLMGQYLGAVPERLLPVRVRQSGPFLFANVDPVADEASQPPAMTEESFMERREGAWRAQRSNWKLAGASLVDVARTHVRGGALNRIEAKWHFPNLVIIRSRKALASVILQPTAMDQTLWRVSYFSSADISGFDAAHATLTQLIDSAAERATAAQSAIELSPTDDVTEMARAGWQFNQQLVDCITRRHVAYWNAPLVDATVTV
ncbi:MAG: hypothetical protein ACRC9K_06025 [Afipia sp.]